MKKLRKALLIGAAGILGAGALAGCGSSASTAGSAGAQASRIGPTSAYNGFVLTKAYSLPSGTFSSTAGGTASVTAPAKGDLTLVFYGFTHCTDDCPTTVADVSAAWRGLPAADQKRITFDLITTDPWRDTTSVMKTWLDRYDLPSSQGLTASWNVIHDSGSTVGVDVEKPTSFEGDYQVTHGLQVLGYTSDGKAHIEWLVEQITVPQLRADLERVLSGAAIE
ncbi:SCO family protein [Actinospica sp. MGRD01-02]|uniref:SCO family protein n=1 Tax=Actinospica acidithermotolerans TaxID=2828514 RepID=A0A941EGE4_9ACTN|nr:SCO family protein [Actinospica acidithermotolerans]MBR7828624.1 SCO family protein [Actinospica acidithermotolerans]